MMKLTKSFSLLLLVLATSTICAQNVERSHPLSVACLTTVPFSNSDNIQPILGAVIMGYYEYDRSDILDLAVGLGVGITGSRLQILDIDENAWWEQVDERLGYVKFDMMISSDLGQKRKFRLEGGPGIKYMFAKHLKGTIAEEINQDGRSMVFRKESKSYASPHSRWRPHLSLRILYQAMVHGISVNLGPYYDHELNVDHDVNLEVSSRALGFYLGIAF